MHPVIAACHPQIAALCRRYDVLRLDVFGSAATGVFDPATSDIDFIVEFGDMTPVAYKRAFFGLLWGLEALLNRPIDLVTAPSLRNPIFIENVHITREPVYGG